MSWWINTLPVFPTHTHTQTTQRTGVYTRNSLMERAIFQLVTGDPKCRDDSVDSCTIHPTAVAGMGHGNNMRRIDFFESVSREYTCFDRVSCLHIDDRGLSEYLTYTMLIKMSCKNGQCVKGCCSCCNRFFVFIRTLFVYVCMNGLCYISYAEISYDMGCVTYFYY